MPNKTWTQLSMEHLSPNVYWIGFKTTTVKALLVTDQDKALLVDSMYGEYAEKIAAHLENEGIELKYIINTHYHGDHTEGNMLFESAEIIAHERTLQHIKDSSLYGPSNGFGQENLPRILFSERMQLFLGATPVDLYHFGPAHTLGDAIVHIPSVNILCVGDIMLDAKYTLPFVSKPEQALNVLDRILSLTDGDTQVVTGHGTLANRNDIISLMNIIRKTVDYAKSGKPVEDYPEEWNQWNSDFLSMKAWLNRLRKLYKQHP